MKTEIDSIKTHFATKADVIRWVVGVGLATILSILGFITEFRKEMREETRQHTLKLDRLSEETRQNTLKLDRITEKMDRLAK